MIKYLFDTYALMEIIFGNKNYIKFLDAEFIINEFILAEFCYNLIKLAHPEKDNYLKDYEKQIQRVNLETIKKAMTFKYKNKKKKLSMTDCISYVQAREMGIKFLTGDKEFKDIEEVEFVK